MTGTPKARASDSISGSPSSLARICGRFSRLTAPLCRSMTWVQWRRISVVSTCASRDAIEPVSDAGEGAVEIAPVGQVARLGNETVDVDHRDRDQGAAQRSILVRQQAANDFDAVDFVAVNGRADQQHRSGLAAVHDVHRHVDAGVGVETRQRNIDRLPPAGLDADAGDLDGGTPFSPCHGSWFCPV